MKNEQIVIVGGGYGGLQVALKLAKKGCQVTLVDQRAWHLRKVKLFKAAVGEAELKAPFSKLEEHGIQFVQAKVTSINYEAKQIILTGAKLKTLSYDRLVLAVGAPLRQADEAQGGVSLTNIEQAQQLKEHMQHCLKKAAQTNHRQAQDKLLSMVVVGGGISGIETATELAAWLRSERSKHNIDPTVGTVHLVSSTPRLLPQAPISVSRKLSKQIVQVGVQMHLGNKALHHQDDVLTLENGTTIPAATCVWTLGMQPNPVIASWGVPHDERGKILVDSQYRVTDWPGVYAIGDCARVIDPVSGAEDGMSCREALNQAQHLADVIQSDLIGASTAAPHHQPAIHMFCIALGPGKGFVWGRKWGLDFVLTGKLGAKLRDYTWKLAELI